MNTLNVRYPPTLIGCMSMMSCTSVIVTVFSHLSVFALPNAMPYLWTNNLGEDETEKQRSKKIKFYFEELLTNAILVKKNSYENYSVMQL